MKPCAAVIGVAVCLGVREAIERLELKVRLVRLEAPRRCLVARYTNDMNF